MQLYGFLRSRSNRAHLALEELEIPYEFYQINFKRGDQRSPYFLNLNPSGKMPVLVDGSLVLTESGAICTYLAEKYPEKGMIPADLAQRAKYHQWMYFIQTELEQPLWNKGKHTFALPEVYRIPALLDTAIYEFEKAVALASEGLGDKTWMVGDSFTMVDICLAHTVRWAVNFEFPVPQANLMAHMERVESRPAFARMLNTKCLDIPQD